MKRSYAILVTVVLTVSVCAQQQLLGEWKTIDDKTKIEKSIVKIFKATDGFYYGKIERLLEDKYKGAVCIPCTGAEKDKPVEGMIIIKKMKLEGEKLTGGQVLDPESGHVYYAHIYIDKKTGHLILRGSIDKRGVLGRNQAWIRF